jgi:ribosomal protein S18 acetylase RimI-like enzyme
MHISIVNAKNEHLDQLVGPFITTGYDTATDKYNTLGIDATNYIKEYKIRPLIPFTFVAIDTIDPNKIFGMLSSGPFNLVMNSIQDGHYPEKINEMASSFYEIYKTDIPESYHIFRLAIEKSSRNNGIGEKLFYYSEATAKDLGFQKITLTVWSCQINAIRFYLKYGMEIKKCYHISDKLPYPNLLYLEKNISQPLTEDYFESNDYATLELI